MNWFISVLTAINSILYFSTSTPRLQTQKSLGNILLTQPFNGTWVKSIDHCPHLPPRDHPSESVWDLRPDEFSFIMALGDSITAGWFLRGIQSTPEITSHEFRGASWAAGGSHGEITFPNLLKHYSTNLTGYSKGHHPVEICYGHLCPVGPVGWTPRQDRLNAALSGSLAENLPHQARDYLVPMAHHIFEKYHWKLDKSERPMKWTYLNLQIGSNDLCALCSSPGVAVTPGSPDLFELNIRETLEIVRKFIPGVMVNIVGVLDVSKIHVLSDNGRDSYCAEAIEFNEFKCSCALREGKLGDLTRSRMKFLEEQYNERLIRIVEYYQDLQDPMFGTVFQPGSALNLSEVPIEALSSADCFHPSLLAHQRLARGVFSRLTRSSEEKSIPIDWEKEGTWVRCLNPDDRIR